MDTLVLLNRNIVRLRRDGRGVAVLPDCSSSGIAITETASMTFSGPPFGGQTPAEKAVLRSDARCARLSKPQMWVIRGGPSSAYMLITKCAAYCCAGAIAASHPASVGGSPPGFSL
jgi:hypothetical protein